MSLSSEEKKNEMVINFGNAQLLTHTHIHRDLEKNKQKINQIKRVDNNKFRTKKKPKNQY